MLSADCRDSAVVEDAFALQCRDKADDEAQKEHQKTTEHATCNRRDRPTTTDHAQQSSTDRPRHGDGESGAGQTPRAMDEKASEHAPVPAVLRRAASRRPRETDVDDGRYDACLTRIRQRLAGRKIWASVDETTDPKDGEVIGNVVVGTLSPDGPGEAFLLASGVLSGGCGGGDDGDGADPEAAARLFGTAAGLLWPEGGGGGELSLLVYGLRRADCDATAGWPGVGPGTVVVACVARQLHAAAERIRAGQPAADALVSMARRASLHGPGGASWIEAASWIEVASYLNENLAAVRGALADRPDRRVSWPVWRAGRLTVDPRVEPGLAFVDLNYGFLPATIARLEARGVPLTRAVAAVYETAGRLADVPGELGAAVHRRFADALRDNRGFRVLADVADVMAGRSVTMDRLPERMSGADIKYYKYAPVAAVDARAVFPRLEAVFSKYNRLRCGERSLNRLLVVQCNGGGGDADGCTAEPARPTRVPAANRRVRPRGHDVVTQSTG